MKRRRILGLSVIIAAVVVASVASWAGAKGSAASALPRADTLYTTGTMWGPYSDFNPFKNWDYVTGTVGLVYETPFRYDPLADKWIPWLATSGSWTSKNVYTMTVRSGVKWSDGQALTPADFKFTWETMKNPNHPGHTVWANGLKSVTTSGNKVKFTFSGTPTYQEWTIGLYQTPIVPQHIWKNYSATDIVSGNLGDTSKLIGTGPMVYMSGKDSNENFVWQKRSGWWATSALKLNVTPKYIVDIYNGSNSASLANLLAGNIDLSNNFVPGIDQQVGGNIQTYFKGAPFMLSANTAWLVPNTTEPPLNDPKFRKALADSINVARIVNADYGNIVTAANPTGLLPIWSKYVDKKLVSQYGFKYSLHDAKALLKSGGYKDVNGDGYVENKDGSKIDLSLIVPNGWSDWMTAIQIIADSAKDAGIKITPAYPDYNTLVDNRGHAKFDLVIANDKQISSTPWEYYDYMFHLPILDNQTTVNYQRFNDPTAWNLVKQLDKTNPSNVAGMKSVLSKLEKIQLQQLPLIPLWYNGAWAQWNTTHWKSWPSSTGKGMQNLPIMWRNYLQMTGINMLTNLKKA
jgi:peptide/nickel transport system substrate-binding protein